MVNPSGKDRVRMMADYSRLMAKARKDEALEAIVKLRKGVPIELLQEEMELLAALDTNQGKGTWKEIFQGVNRVTICPR